MAIPAYGGASAAKAEGTTTISPAIPSGVATGDLMLFCGAGSNTGAWSVNNQGGGNWQQAATGDVGTTTTTANSTIWYDYYNGTQTAPTFNTPGNHGVGRIIYITGARSSDGPSFGGRGQDLDGGTSASTSLTFTSGITTSDADCLIVLVAASVDDNPTFGATWTNANLASITNRVTDTTIQGNDSSLSVVTGTLATAGAVGNFTNTLTGNGNTCGNILAIRPPAAGQSLTGVALSATPSLPAGTLGPSTLTGTALSATPSLPAGTVGPSKLTGAALSATPTLPAGSISEVAGQTINGVALSATPTLPAGTLGPSKLNGVALSATPTLPAGTLGPSKLTGAALSATPTLPAGTLGPSRLTGAALSATPTLPAGSVSELKLLTGTALSMTPTLPAGMLGPSQLTGVALSATPTLPVAQLLLALTVQGVALEMAPVLPAGQLSLAGSGVEPPDPHQGFRWFTETPRGFGRAHPNR